MAENRLNRELETRSKDERVKQWAPPQLLPDPTPEPGYVYRWVRVSTLGNQDPMNVSSKLREGWEPVKASDHPEVFIAGSGQGRFADAVEVGGLVLCKTPEELAKQRDAFYQKQSEGQLESVDNSFMRENNPRMPLFKERRSEVTFGRGSTQK